jgi:hypothetical protein
MHKLTDEFDAVPGGNWPEINQLAQFPFLLYLIKKNMRILPTVACTVHATTRDVMLDPFPLVHVMRVLVTEYLPIVFRNFTLNQGNFASSVGNISEMVALP